MTNYSKTVKPMLFNSCHSCCGSEALFKFDPVQLYPRLSLVFTALRGMQMRSSDENSVRPSCLSVKHVHCDKTEERSVHIFIPYESLFSLVF